MKQPRLTAAEWGRARVLVEAGETHAETARRFGCQPETITRRAKKEGWRNAIRETGKRRVVATSEALLNGEKTNFISLESNEQEQPGDNCNEVAFVDRLKEAAEGPPEEFQDRVARLTQAWLASGAAAVPAPRNMAEFKTAFDIFRKATGLDAKDKGAAPPASLIPGMRSLTRRTVEAEVVPEPDMDDI